MKVFLDAETTHLEPGQIAQLAYIVTDDDLNIVTAKSFYFSVETMSRGASQVNGLNKRKLATLSEGKKFMHHVFEIKNDIKNYELICHNNDFDYGFVWEEFRRHGQRYRPKSRFCTMKHFTNVCRLPGGPGGAYKWPRLTEVMRHLGIKRGEVVRSASQAFNCDAPSAHDSRFDVMAVYLIYKESFQKPEVGPAAEGEPAKMLVATLDEIAATRQSSEQPAQQATPRDKTAAHDSRKRRMGCLVILIILWLIAIVSNQ